MILTVTMNPSVDIMYQLDELVLDDVNRVQTIKKTAGGKGLNVSRVAYQQGEAVTATGLVGGELGEFVKHQLTEQGIQHHFSMINGKTRNCIAIIHEGNQTEILESGPSISEEEVEEFITEFETLLPDSDVVTISGSLPAGVPSAFYTRLIAKATQHHIPVLLDTSGTALEQALSREPKPTVIKPNLSELASLLQTDEQQIADNLAEYLQQPLFKGVDIIVVSLGADGAFVKWHDSFYRVTIPKIDVVSPVGSGDATLAGLAVGLSREEQPEVILKRAMAAGMLNAQQQATGMIEASNMTQMMSEVKVHQ